MESNRKEDNSNTILTIQDKKRRIGSRKFLVKTEYAHPLLKANQNFINHTKYSYICHTTLSKTTQQERVNEKEKKKHE